MSVFPAPSLSCQIKDINAFYDRYFPDVKAGTFVEVGANDGYSWSNTWHLAQLGWRGLYFEPVTELADQCQIRHAGNNVKVINSAVGELNGETKLFTGQGATTSEHVATFNTFYYGNSQEKYIVVPVCSLNSELSLQNWPKQFELLVVDVDGDEIGVLRGLDLEIWQPRMIIIETSKDHPITEWRFNAAGIDALLSQFYDEVWHDHINSIYIRSAERKEGKPLMATLFESKRDLLLKVGGWYGCKNFVETGTGMGDMLAQVYPYFGEVHSIELLPELFRQVTERFKRVINIRLYPGDSADQLPKIIPNLKGTTLFYLDAHYSGLGTARGSMETPILAELKALLSVPKFNHVILIDDLKHFTGENGYPSTALLKQYVRKLQPDAVFEIMNEGNGMILIAPAGKKRNLSRKLSQVTPVAVLGKAGQPILEEYVPGHLQDPHRWERPPILYGPYRNPGGK